MSQKREGFGKFLLTVGLLIMFHSAYSTAEWRAYDRKTTPIDETDAMMPTQEVGPTETVASRGFLGGLPADIAVETFIGLLICMIGVLNIAGDFKEIRASIEMSQKTWENAGNRPSFYVYNHRGKAFSPDYVAPT